MPQPTPPRSHLRTWLMFGLYSLLSQAAQADTICMPTPEVGSASARVSEQTFARALRDYTQGRHRLAAHQFAQLAAAGHPAARYNLGVMHLRAEVRSPSVARAHTLLEAAAACGFATAMLKLGEWYEGPQFGTPRLDLALHWYQMAAEAGSVDGQVATATAYYMGRGTPTDGRQAAHWYRLAANAGDVGAQYILGSMYEQGDGVEADRRLARYWFSTAARQGDVAAQAKLTAWDTEDAATAPPSPSGAN